MSETIREQTFPLILRNEPRQIATIVMTAERNTSTSIITVKLKYTPTTTNASVASHITSVTLTTGQMNTVTNTITQDDITTTETVNIWKGVYEIDIAKLKSQSCNPLYGQINTPSKYKMTYVGQVNDKYIPTIGTFYWSNDSIGLKIKCTDAVFDEYTIFYSAFYNKSLSIASLPLPTHYEIECNIYDGDKLVSKCDNNGKQIYDDAGNILVSLKNPG